jgi:hypothetical protein
MDKEVEALILKDFLLSVEQLDEKYNPEGGGEHPLFTRLDWRHEVYDENTVVGYWQWVYCRLCESVNDIQFRNSQKEEPLPIEVELARKLAVVTARYRALLFEHYRPYVGDRIPIREGRVVNESHEAVICEVEEYLKTIPVTY